MEQKPKQKIEQLMPRAQSRAIVLAGLFEWLKERPNIELRLRVAPRDDAPGEHEIWATLAIDGGKELNVLERMIEPTAGFIAIEKACQLHERYLEPATPATPATAEDSNHGAGCA